MSSTLLLKIEEESVPAIAAFLASIAPRPNFSFHAYQTLWQNMQSVTHEDRWYEAYGQANDTLHWRS